LSRKKRVHDQQENGTYGSQKRKKAVEHRAKKTVFLVQMSGEGEKAPRKK